MKNVLLFEMKHIKNNLVNITQMVDGTTEAGREILTALASIRDQIQTTTDNLKAI
jgi:hypothetical protein